MYAITGFGITIGYHRLSRTARSRPRRPVRVRARDRSARWPSRAASSRGSPTTASTTRFADEEGDPHSPHVDHERGFAARCRASGTRTSAGCFGDRRTGAPSARRYAPDLIDDQPIRWVNRTFLFWVAADARCSRSSLGFAARAASRSSAACSALAVGRPRADLPAAPHDVVDQLRLPLLRRAALRRSSDESRNVFWLALPSLGEAWHHNHHAFPTSAFHGLRPLERLADPSGLADRGDGEARARLERRARQPRAPGQQGAGAEARSRPAAPQTDAYARLGMRSTATDVRR